METQIAKLGAELVILGTEEMMHLPVEIELNDKKSLAKKYHLRELEFERSIS